MYMGIREDGRVVLSESHGLLRPTQIQLIDIMPIVYAIHDHYSAYFRNINEIFYLVNTVRVSRTPKPSFYTPDIDTTDPDSGYLKIASTIVHLLAVLYLDRRTMHSFNKRSPNEIYDYIEENAYRIVDDGQLEVLCEPMFDTLSEFMGRDNWHIYYVELMGGSLCVKKTIDFRIYDWMSRRDMGLL